MTLTRVPYPSPNYSGGRGLPCRLLVIHTAEGSRTIESLGGWFANPANECSSHAGADDKAGTIGVYVHRTDTAWTQAGANGVAASIELCGFAAWDSAEWHRHPNMLDNLAGWLREESAAFGIPLVRLTPAQAQNGGVGVCQHIDLGPWGGGHVDCGPGFPYDEVLAMAGGAPAPAPGPPATGGAPPFPGTLLVDYTEGHGTAQWQAQMAARGWTIDVDDKYGSQSAGVCRQFQAEKRLTVDGVVGPDTWAAAWTAPVT